MATPSPSGSAADAETVVEYGVRYPDGHVETDWDQTLEAAQDEAADVPGSVVVSRRVTSTPWSPVRA